MVRAQKNVLLDWTPDRSSQRVGSQAARPRATSPSSRPPVAAGETRPSKRRARSAPCSARSDGAVRPGSRACRAPRPPGAERNRRPRRSASPRSRRRPSTMWSRSRSRISPSCDCSVIARWKYAGILRASIGMSSCETELLRGSTTVWWRRPSSDQSIESSGPGPLPSRSKTAFGGRRTVHDAARLVVVPRASRASRPRRTRASRRPSTGAAAARRACPGTAGRACRRRGPPRPTTSPRRTSARA